MGKTTGRRFPCIHLVIPPSIRRDLEAFLVQRSANGSEAFAFLLCGRHSRRGLLRLLARHIILPEDDCFERRNGGTVECSRTFDEFVLEMADQESLAIIAVHTHVHAGQVEFSGMDDRCERDRAIAIHRTLGGRVALGSVVYDQSARYWRARLWCHGHQGMWPIPVRIVSTIRDTMAQDPTKEDPRFVRQIQAFGSMFQGYLHDLRAGIVGVGGLGSMVVEGLARLGVRQWVLVDPDQVEFSNLNRLLGATPWDAADSIPKVEVARRNIRLIHEHRSEVRILGEHLPSPIAARLLSDCDVLIAATDDHSSRLALQEIASAYLRPLVNAGVGLNASNGQTSAIGARVNAPPVGGPWCLACGGLIDAYRVAKERSDTQHREMLHARGYLADTPQPAVYWVNGVAANLAIGMVHSLVMPYREQVAEDLYADLLNPELLTISHEKDGNGCVVCGAAGGGLRGIGDAYRDRKQVEIGELDIRQPLRRLC